MFPNNFGGATTTVVKKKSMMMNPLGDFPSPTGIPPQAYSSQFHVTTAPNPYANLPMSPISTKPKLTASSIAYYNGYPPLTPPVQPKMNHHQQYNHNSSGYSNPSSTTVSTTTAAAGGRALNQNQNYDKPNKTVFNENGNVLNLPQSMLTDPYGLAAFFVGMEARKSQILSSPDVIGPEVWKEMDGVLNKGSNSNEPAYKNFSGPLSMPTEPSSFTVEAGQGAPLYPEYLVVQRLLYEEGEDAGELRKKWALKMEHFSDDLLFYTFYTFTQDLLQVLAATHLYQKGWRFHIDAKVWLQKLDNVGYVVHNGNPSLEKGIYKYFDYVNWKTAQSEMLLDTSKLEGPPKVPQDMPSGPKH